MSTQKNSSQKARLAVVAGGAHGIGEATSRLFVERGWRVVVADRDEAGARALGEELDSPWLALDVTRHGDIEAAAERIEREWGPVSALVASAGAFQGVLPPEALEAELWDRIFAVNVAGPFRLAAAFGPRMAARGGGSIVNVASITGTVGAPTHAYAPSKAAVINMTANLACEWGHAGVRVNAVSPGVTLVQRILDRWAAGGGSRAAGAPEAHAALMRCVEPREVAEAIFFLSCDAASAITGVDLPVDAGWGCASGWEMFGGPRKPAAATAA